MLVILHTDRLWQQADAHRGKIFPWNNLPFFYSANQGSLYDRGGGPGPRSNRWGSGEGKGPRNRFRKAVWPIRQRGATPPYLGPGRDRPATNDRGAAARSGPGGPTGGYRSALPAMSD
ncbi:hypothetical protein GCM10027570_38160 [Streptomonospora sediminis]